MGLLWRLFAPKPLKKARRTVRRATHPVSLITPKPVKKVRSAVGTVAHPLEAAEFAAQNQIVRVVRGGGKKRARTRSVRSDGLPARFTDQWIRRTMPGLDREQAMHVVSVMRERGWSDAELRTRVSPYMR
jgi:hypothetical protein